MKPAASLIVLCVIFWAHLCTATLAQTNTFTAPAKSANGHVDSGLSSTLANMSSADWAAWAAAAAAIANLVVIVVFFMCGNTQHENEQKARIAGFWIEELIMRQHHALIHKFFDDYEERLKHPMKAAEGVPHERLLEMAGDEIIAFKNQLLKIDHQIIYPLQWIHDGFVDLVPIRNEIEDLVTTQIQKIPGMAAQDVGNGQKDPQYRLSELRKKFFKTIHKYQAEALLNPPKTKKKPRNP